MQFVVLLSALGACAAGVPLNSTKPRIDARIIGGSDADIADFPYQVSLRTRDSNNTYLCGGVIISNEWVVTAAHCIYTQRVLNVRSGSIYSTKGGKTHNVTKHFFHFNYNDTTYDYDIAVLKVDPPFNSSIGAREITLDEEGIPCSNSAVVSGWGNTSDKGNNSEILQQVTVQVFTYSHCRWAWLNYWTSRKICAGHSGSRKGTCVGDSGGPLVVNGTLVGIASTSSKKCADYKEPDMYTKIFAVRDWIRDNTGV